MCGIAGVVASSGDLAPMLTRANSLQCHRGPDHQAHWQGRVGGWQVGLAFQRLSILDLSDAGNQPMEGPCGHARTIFNGEVYNYLELRQQLAAEGFSFVSESDTEVMLAALDAWGVERALQAFNGMWAFAWLDERRQRLVLARDRMGIKPLYVWRTRDRLIFSSEIKTVLALAGRRFALDKATVHAYLGQALLDSSDGTFFEGIVQVPAGSFLSIDLTCDELEPRPTRYWRAPIEEIADADPSEMEARVRDTFIDAVKLRLRSDVPVGVLLSGGIDSSAIACAAQQVSGENSELTLLSAVSSDPRHDESPFIDRVGSWLGRPVQKVSLDLEPDEALSLLEQVSWNNDEPVGSFTSVAHYKLMETARELGVTVVLSGQGADELLCGYKKYLMFHLQQLARERAYGRALATAVAFQRQGTVLAQFNLAEARRYLPQRLRAESGVLGTALAGMSQEPVGLMPGETLQGRQRRDLERYSVPQLLHYEDRMSMAVGREIRLPFLDVNLVEMLLPLAPRQKLQAGWTKHLFRRALAPLLPPEITWRRDKRGFSLPQDAWMRGPLRERVLAAFGPEAHIFRLGLVDRERLLRRYELYCRQRPERSTVWYREVFHPLALEVWLRTFADSIEGADG